MSTPTARGSLSAPLKDRNFRLLWAGQGISALGNAMYKVTLAWSVYTVTGSSAAMGIVLAANIIPQLLLTLYGGAVGDRMSRRTVLLAADSTAAVITGLLAWVTLADRSSIVMIAAASFGLGVVTAFFLPAQYPLIRNALPAEHQQAASAIYSSTNTVTTVAGPLLAALVLAFSGVAYGFAVDAATFVIAAISTWLMRLPNEKITYSGTIGKNIKDGLRYVATTTWLRVSILLSVIANVMCIAPLYVLLPAIVKEHGGGSTLFGVMIGVQACSTAVFALLAGKYVHRVPRGVAIYALATVTGVAIALLGATNPRHWVVFAVVVVLGFGFAFDVVETTMIQERVPTEYLSRVYSVNAVVSYALAPVGYLLAGMLGQQFDKGALLVGGGALFAAITVMAAFTTRWNLDDPVVTEPMPEALVR